MWHYQECAAPWQINFLDYEDKVKLKIFFLECELRTLKWNEKLPVMYYFLECEAPKNVLFAGRWDSQECCISWNVRLPGMCFPVIKSYRNIMYYSWDANIPGMYYFLKCEATQMYYFLECKAFRNILFAGM